LAGNFKGFPRSKICTPNHAKKKKPITPMEREPFSISTSKCVVCGVHHSKKTWATHRFVHKRDFPKSIRCFEQVEGHICNRMFQKLHKKEQVPNPAQNVSFFWYFSILKLKYLFSASKEKERPEKQRISHKSVN